MINIRALKAKMLEKGYTQYEMAKAMNITEKTLSLKLKRGVFKTNEVDLMRDILGLSDTEGMKIFFAKDVS